MTDPICGMEVDESTPLRAERGGETFYFCSEHCLQKFLAKPHEAAKEGDPRSPLREPGPPRHQPGHCCGGKTDAAKPTPTPVGKYFCPMCPGVSSDKPGACPKCGMALERNPSWKPLAVYTCPMHPEIEQDHPGSCPKCGMALELRRRTSVDEGAEDDSELRDMTRRFWVGLMLTLPVFVVAMAHVVPAWSHAAWLNSDAARWMQFALSTPVVLWAGWPFFVRGARSVLNRSLNMFTLIALGVGAAYVFSVAAMLIPQAFPSTSVHSGKPPIYFEAAAVITVLVLLGQLLELRARQRTSGALKALLGLAPKTARRITAQGDEEVPLEDVRVGDRLRVRPGEKIPVDGEVLEGRTAVDEAMLTGEAMPVEKSEHSKVSAGTINATGGFVMRAERVGGETILAHIVELVARAQRTRAPIQALADKVAGWFVPAVLAISAITFVAWLTMGPEPRLAYAITNAVAVLIIACPCALGLATPMSIMVGVGRGAQLGVLIRDAEAIEKLAQLDSLVVDKTGTLTEGKPRLAHIHSVGKIEEKELLRLAASLEQSSEHPLAHAIVTASQEQKLPLETAKDFQSTTAGGVAGTIAGRKVFVGQVSFLKAQGMTELAGLEDLAHARQTEGETVIFVGVDGQAAGILAVTDPMKATTPQALSELRELGIEVMMLTGDNERTAASIARHLGIAQFQAGVNPQHKFDRVKALQGAGRVVGMAGDGINDAPALAAADVGIAMGSGTDIAMESASVTLVKGDLRAITRAIRLGRAVMRNIRQNLFFAFVYNALGIPIAAGVFYPIFGLLLSPMLAGLAMSLSSVSVIANALRLQRVKL